jgi:hypothetical protein
MTDLEHKEIRGVTWRIAVVVLSGVGTICSTFIWGVAHIENVMQFHEYRLDKMESKIDKIEKYVYPKDLLTQNQNVRR